MTLCTSDVANKIFLLKKFFSTNCVSIYLEVGLSIREDMLQSCLIYVYSITQTCTPRYTSNES